MSAPPRDRRSIRSGRAASPLAVRLLGVAIGVSLVLLAPASAGQVEGEQCPYGAISAIGPVDAAGNGDTAPDVACLVP